MIDYTTADFAELARGIDVVLDPLSGEIGVRSLDVLRPGGLLLDVRGTGPDRTEIEVRAQVRGLRFVNFGFTPSGADLEQIATLVDGGQLRVTVELVLPVSEAARAHRLSETARVRGKIVLTP